MILDCVSENGRTVKTIVLIEPFGSELVALGRECGIDILSLKSFEVRITSESSFWTKDKIYNRQLWADVPRCCCVLSATAMFWLWLNGNESLRRCMIVISCTYRRYSLTLGTFLLFQALGKANLHQPVVSGQLFAWDEKLLILTTLLPSKTSNNLVVIGSQKNEIASLAHYKLQSS